MNSECPAKNGDEETQNKEMLLGRLEVCNRPRVLIIITGGTICMSPACQDGVAMSALSCRSLEAILKDIPELKEPSLPEFDVLEWDELLDSSDVCTASWQLMVSQIASNYDKYEGFVVLHGTDTLAFTASALSFMLENLSKPVVVTGAMLPISHITTDAKRNVAVSLLVAGFSKAPEVLVCFGTRILRANRVVKMDCTVMDAFDSPNCTPLGRVGIEVTLDHKRFLPMPKDYMTPFGKVMADHVAILRLTPEFNPSIIRQLAASETRPLGIVLELFGTGTAPSNPRFLSTLEFAIRAGVTMVAVTQCKSGTCSLKTYANGLQLHELGVIEGKDLTTETAFVKLAYLFGKNLSGAELAAQMETNLRGEMTEQLLKITGQATLRPTVRSSAMVMEMNSHNLASVAPHSQ